MNKEEIINNKSTAVVILAAGLSSRMGTIKPFLKYNSEQLFIDKIIREYAEFGCGKIVITLSNKSLWMKLIENYQSSGNVSFIENQHIEYERFYSLKLGLSNIGYEDNCFIQNSDNPFVNQGILSELYNYKTNKGYVVPVCNGKGGHPILLSKNVITGISKEDDNSNLKDVLQNYKRVECKVDDKNIFVNINTEQDYLKYFRKN